MMLLDDHAAIAAIFSKPCWPKKGQHGFPYGITPAEARFLDALVAHGNTKRVAAALGLSIHTVHCHYQSAAARMGVDSKVAAALVWERWRRASRQSSAHSANVVTQVDSAAMRGTTGVRPNAGIQARP